MCMEVIQYPHMYIYPHIYIESNVHVLPLCVCGRIHGVNELLQLLRSRHKSTLQCYPMTSVQKVTMSLSAASSSPLFYLSELQEDIVTSFLSGKPFILEVSNLRTPFKFKLTTPRTVLHPAE